MNVEQLKKYMKPTERKTKTVYLTAYIEGEDDVTISYKFANQKESHLKISKNVWEGMSFKRVEKGIQITDLNGLKVCTNDSGWSRLITEDQEEDDE